MKEYLFFSDVILDVIKAHTKSEARAEYKKKNNLRRVPTWVRVYTKEQYARYAR